MSDGSPSTFVTNTAVDRMLGILIERTEGLREDTRELRTATASLHDVNASMRLALERMTSEVKELVGQRAQNERVSERLNRAEEQLKYINKYFAEERLPRIEETVKRWQRWMGKGWSFAGKLALAFAASGLIGGSVFGFFAKIATHYTP